MSNALEIQVAKDIRAKKIELKFYNRQDEVDADVVIVKQSAIDELLEKYSMIADSGQYTEKKEDIAYDFCEEFYYELSRPSRDELKIGRFYDISAVLNIVGKDTFVGKQDVAISIIEKFRDLTLQQTIEKVTIDPSMCKGGIIHFECVSKLKINDDEPRKIMQIIDLVRSSLPTTYPYVIMKEYFIVQDSRPLYHWPEKKVTLSKHDNWEPQFKPKVVERPKSAVGVAPVAVVETLLVPAVEDEEEEYYNEDEGGDVVEEEYAEGVEGDPVEHVGEKEEQEGQEAYGEGYYEGAEGYAEGEYEEGADEEVYDSYEEQAPHKIYLSPKRFQSTHCTSFDIVFAMDWSHIERDVAIRTDTMTQRRFEFHNAGQGTADRPHKISKLLDGILSSKLLVDDKPSRESKPSFDENANQQHSLLKTVLGDLAELQSGLRTQASKLEMFEGSCMKFDHEAVNLRKNQESLFNRVDHIESGLQGKSSDVDVIDLYHDMQLRLKRVESNLEGLEENSRMFQVQFATKDAFSKLLDTIFDQLKTLSSTVELSKEQCNHASILFDALANAFVLLNGDDNRHQLELVTSFSRDINKEHLSRILTDALMRSVDGSIQAHLKPAMGLMHSSILELINEMRDRQDAFSQSMRSNFGQLSRQFQDEKVNLADYVPRNMAPLPPAEPKMDATFLAEIAQMKEQMDTLVSDNKSLRESLEEQSHLLSNLTTAQETQATLDAEHLLKLKSHCEAIEHDAFALKQDFSVVQVDCNNALSTLKDITMAQEIAEKKVSGMETLFTEKLQTVQISIKDNYVDFSTRLNTKADLAQFTRESEDLQGQCKQHAVSLRNLQTEVNARATKIDVDSMQSKVDVVSSDVNILQGDVHTIDKKVQTRLKGHDEDIEELRKLCIENADLTNKLSKRVDLTEATLQGKVSNLGTELHHKVADSIETVGRLLRRVDVLDTDLQSSSVSLRETQVKLQTQADGTADLTRRVNILDANCSSQFQSLSSVQKNHAEEVTDSLAKLTRKMDLNAAEMQSKFNIRSDRVDVQLTQNQESMSKLVDRLELSEHKQLAQLEELSTEVRGKISGALDFSAQLNRRFETHQSESHTKFTTVQTDLVALSKTLHERINQVVKQTDANIELTTSQLTAKHSETMHKVQSLGDSFSHLAQQQFDLCALQEKQQLDLSNLTVELNTVRNKLDEKVSTSMASLQSSLAIHTKSHQAALAEEKYDLLQLTSRVALLEQLIRYGQDLEDYNNTTFGSAESTSFKSDKNDRSAGAVRTLAPRPADPEVRQQLKELKLGLDEVRDEASSARSEMDSRLDSLKVGLSALRTQFEEEMEEAKESADNDQKRFGRVEQMQKSLQAQIDVLQDEIQEMGQIVHEIEPNQKASTKQVASPVRSVRSASIESPARVPFPSAVSTAVAAKLSEHGHNVTTASSAVVGGSFTAPDKPATKLPSAPSSPEKPNFASLRAAMLAPAPAASRTPPRPGARLEDSFDEGSSFEGSDVFPLSPSTPVPASPAVSGVAAGWNKKAASTWNKKAKEDEEVSPFSPGSDVSPPPKGKLSIQTFSPAGTQQNAALDPPDSPWDVDSEDEEEEEGSENEEEDSLPPKKPLNAGPTGTAQQKLPGGAKSVEEEDSSSIDSEVKVKHTLPHSSSIAKLVIPSAFGGAAGTAKGPLSTPKTIPGPSVASIAQFSGTSGSSGAGAGKSPAKAKLSGSLLSSGRSSGPSLGFK